jgi:putative oxidoreductase
MTIMTNSKFPWVSLILAHYVAFAHLVGGFMIAIGLLTRIAIIFQLPVLIGAVIFVNAQRGFFSENSELMFSVIILFMLVFFFIYGSGPISIDESWNKEENLDENRT